jgi:DNA-binding FrmR family transcriptional regulator
MKAEKGASHQKQIHRLKRVSGQVQGVLRMVEDQRYCVDILTQIKAIQSALAGIERQIVEEHLRHCVSKAVAAADTDRAQEVIAEIIEVLKSSKGSR